MYCTTCGNHNPEGSKFCKHCGRQFDKRATNVEEPKIEKQKMASIEKAVHTGKKQQFFRPKILVLMIVVLFIIFSCGGIGIYFALQKLTIPTQHRNIGVNVDVTGK